MDSAFESTVTLECMLFYSIGWLHASFAYPWPSPRLENAGRRGQEYTGSAVCQLRVDFLGLARPRYV